MENEIVIRLTLLVTTAIWLCGCETPAPPEPPSLHPLESYAVRARILKKKAYTNPKDYWAPLDVALAWGELLDPAATKDVIVMQGDRKYWYYPPAGSYAADHMQRNSANTHLVAENEATRKKILALEEDKTYYFEGILVEAVFPDGRKMTSSLSRDDIGKGACEVFLIKTITPLH